MPAPSSLAVYYQLPLGCQGQGFWSAFTTSFLRVAVEIQHWESALQFSRPASRGFESYIWVYNYIFKYIFTNIIFLIILVEKMWVMIGWAPDQIQTISDRITTLCCYCSWRPQIKERYIVVGCHEVELAMRWHGGQAAGRTGWLLNVCGNIARRSEWSTREQWGRPESSPPPPPASIFGEVSSSGNFNHGSESLYCLHLQTFVSEGARPQSWWRS